LEKRLRSRALCWLRRDLRLSDQRALAHACQNHDEVQLCFIFDSQILAKISDHTDQRISFIHQGLLEIEKEISSKYKASLHIEYGDPVQIIPELCKKFKVSSLYLNADYDPYSKIRDQKVKISVESMGLKFYSYKDHVIFEKHEVLTQGSDYYKVFTPYKNQWRQEATKNPQSHADFKPHLEKLSPYQNTHSLINSDWFKKINFEEVKPIMAGGEKEARKRFQNFKKKMDAYHKDRDFPYLEGTSNLSAYLRFGMISTRELVRYYLENTSEGAKSWLNEIIWRDFYHMILDAFPHVAKKSFKEKYDGIKWPGDQKLFKAWCEGRTGVPIVDAAMRELNQTGMMPNRLRMVVGSYLCKILLVSWQKGEAYFRDKLFDYDLAANNGGWQWCSSTGCDAAPYFRIFNPYTQSKKFDPEAKYIKKWLPELSALPSKVIHDLKSLDANGEKKLDFFLDKDYPSPIVDYEQKRKECLALFT
jgi:deoxyribodipyrimidine photo-lyase